MLRILSFILLCSSLNAELTWLKTKLDYKAKLTEKHAKFRFKFKNNSPREITISKILSSCDCTRTELKSKTIPAHSSGTISAQMDLKGVKGIKSSTLKIYLNGSSTPSHTLTVKVDVPSPIQITPIFLNWRKNDERKSKKVTITIHPSFKAKLIKIDSKEQGFQAILEDQDTSSQILKITPPSKEQVKNGREKITLHFEDSKGKISKKSVYLFVY